MPADGPRSLAPLTTLRLGGPARSIVIAASSEELVALVRSADARAEPALLLGGGSNVVIADEGFPGTVVRIATRGIERERTPTGERWTVAAGEPWDALVALATAAGLSGIEALAGIPGLTGATPIQNVGAYGQEIASVVESLGVLDRSTGATTRVPASACGFGYRTSRFKRSAEMVVLDVALELGDDNAHPVRYAELARALGIPLGGSAPAVQVREAVLALRRSKGMVLDDADHDTWSAGSFFTNPVLSAGDWSELVRRCETSPPAYPDATGGTKTSAAWLIERAGFARGHSRGAARISGKHTLALTNRGGATTADLLALAREVRAGVEERFGVRLEPEPVLVGCAL